MDDQETHSAPRAGFNRTESGRFAAVGQGGPGRGKGTARTQKAVAYIHATYESVKIEEWKAIVAKAKRDALGLRIIERDGRTIVVDDPESLGTVRSLARTFLRDSLIGKPPQAISIERGDESNDPHIAYSDLTDAELRAIANGTSEPEPAGDLTAAELANVANGLARSDSGGDSQNNWSNPGDGAADAGRAGGGAAA